MRIYRQLRETIEDLIDLQGIEIVEKELGIVVKGVKHTRIENVPNDR